MILTPYQRADAYAAAFPDFAANGSAFVKGRNAEGQETIYATMFGGQDYQNASKLYGCLSGETRLLTADLQWVKQQDVRVGDALMGVTERSEDDRRRRLEVAKVLEVGPVRLPSLRLKLDDGTSIVCSHNHRWLVAGAACSRWTDASKLRLGDRIRRIVPAWTAPEPVLSGWMGGIIDGEANLDTGSGLVLRISQNPGAHGRLHVVNDDDAPTSRNGSRKTLRASMGWARSSNLEKEVGSCSRTGTRW